MSLIVVPTPIGNLEDITLRALRELREADAIACEDTRRTLKLLNHYEIKKTLVSYHQHNERSRTPELIARMERGERVALVSDAGAPGISDPGYILITEAIAIGVPVDVLPGPSAILPALLMSGLSPQPFTFFGFIDIKKGKKNRGISKLAELDSTLVFYVAPHDLARGLVLLRETLGDRDAVIVREISKVHQEIIRGRIEELEGIASSREIRGEIVLVIAGRGREPEIEQEVSWRDEALRMKAEGIFDREIAGALFKSYGIPRNEVKDFLIGAAEENGG
jgi:16S rRNA (cytidine1402-2'-O)-methyltransferase